jgi:hypothetical protein
MSNTVFFAAIQRKGLNHWDLPIRYERYFVIWLAASPSNILAINQHPALLNETGTGWIETEADIDEAKYGKQGVWARMTHTTTIASAWGRGDDDIREKGTGYLDDEVILSVGVEVHDQVYATATASELLQCSENLSRSNVSLSLLVRVNLGMDTDAIVIVIFNLVLLCLLS